MRAVVFERDDVDLAIALNAIGRAAQSEGWRFNGFHSWERTPVAALIVQNLPPNGAP
jgi:hypothetical protein